MARDTTTSADRGKGRSGRVDRERREARVRAFRLGTEHEKVPFRPVGLEPVPYEGGNGIRALLEQLGERIGWEPILEQDRPIGLADSRGGGAISLDPGGQFELSGAPVETLHETEAETARHIADVKANRGGARLPLPDARMSPLWTRAQTPVMPKSRYRIMANYMPKVGSKGLDMMFRTTTVQEPRFRLRGRHGEEAARQPRAAAAGVGPFANSPFTDGKPNGFLSYRSEIWRDTDNARAGMLPFAFEEGMGYERYVDYALDVPM